MKNSRFRYLFGSGTHYKPSKFLNFGDENEFRYQICDTGSDTTKKMQNSRYWEFPVRHTLVGGEKVEKQGGVLVERKLTVLSQTSPARFFGEC